ncbi:MAG TPA: pyridoxamine 5'-phosphate oxidase family protein [Thermoanaerobaculia bacterium]|nr:pyridoxamine 5'-phosphate oxidase family protein [Thermoanaerobaculia bacterium]
MRVLRVTGPFHAGELEAQRRAGVEETAGRTGRMIRPGIPAPAAAFLAGRAFLVAATRERGGAVRASMLTGAPGFARATGESEITIDPAGGHVADVREDVAATGRIGLLAIDLATRRRMRANGDAAVAGPSIRVATREVYANCPQYITPREEPRFPFGAERSSARLSAAQQERIRGADTFFVASAHPATGPDASHRGGPPGFVEVSETAIRWRDFPGNRMFNTIGNLLVEPRCGLLFPDFATGAVLRIEGRAEVVWEPEREIRVEVARVAES